MSGIESVLGDVVAGATGSCMIVNRHGEMKPFHDFGSTLPCAHAERDRLAMMFSIAGAVIGDRVRAAPSVMESGIRAEHGAAFVVPY